MRAKISLTSKITLVLLLGLFVFVGKIKYQQYKSQKAIDREKRGLQQQISDLEDKNQNLSQSLTYLGSDDFKERMARQQLNLKKDGEVVFGFRDNPAQNSDNDSQDGSTAPNYQKWIQYFFGSN